MTAHRWSSDVGGSQPDPDRTADPYAPTTRTPWTRTRSPRPCWRRPRRRAARAPAARIDLPPPVPRRLHLPRRHGHRALPARPGDHPLLRLAVPEGPARQHPRLRHRRPRLPQPGDRHRRRTTRPGSPPCATHGPGPDPRHRAQPHGRRHQRERLVERRAGERPGLAIRRATSTSPGGPRPARSCRTRSCCRSWATRTATSSRPASSGWPSPTGRSRSTTTTAGSRSPRAATPRSSGTGSTSWSAPWAPRTRASIEYQSILTAIRNLPERTETEPEQGGRAPSREGGDQATAGGAGRRERAGARGSSRRTWRCSTASPGDPRSFDLLDDLLEQQCYRLAYWRVAPDEINYRRFFDINDLAALEHGARGRLRGRPRAWSSGWWPRGRSTGCGSTTPTGSTTPRSTSAGSRSTTPWRWPAGPSRPSPPPRAWTGARWRARSASASPPRLDGAGRAARPAALRRRREDPRRRRGAGRDLAGPRHQRLRLPQPGQRPVRRRRRPRAAFTRLYNDWVQDDYALLRAGLPQEAADHAGLALQRAAHADPPARPAGAEVAAIARLHLQHPSPGAAST